MPYSDMKVDLSLVPDGILKETFIHFAEKHNALVDGANELKQDIDQISGITPEEKQATYTVMEKVREALAYLHGKRFNATLFTIFFYFALATMKLIGLNPDQVGHLLDVILKILEKFAAQ